MSGKKKRKSRGSDNTEKAAVFGILETLRDPSEDSDLCSLTSSLLQLTSTDTCERKTVVHSSSGGVEIIVKTLQRADDPVLVHNLIATLDCLTKHRHTDKLARQGVLPVVLSSMAFSAKCDWCTDDILLYHSLLLHLASKDKHFAIKARLSGVLPVTTGLLKRCHTDHNSLHSLLGVLKILATNSTNAVYLGKHGCLTVFPKLLEGVAKRNYVILKLCADVLTHLLKQKTLSSRPSAQSCIGHLVSLHQHCHHTDRQCRHLPLRRALLNCLKGAMISGAGREAFLKANGLEVLYTTASQVTSDSGKGMKSLATLTCTVLRRSLPKVPLPISSKLNPIKYPLIQHTLTTSEPSTQLTSNALTHTCTCTLHTSHSAPQLTSLNTLRQDHHHTTQPRVAHTHDPCPVSSLTDGAHSTEDPESGSQEHPSSTPPDVSQADCDDQTWCSAEDLTLYDKFFPELKRYEGIARTQSLPLLPTDYVNELTEHLFNNRVEDREHIDEESDSQHCQFLSPLVIPTAPSLGEPSEKTLDTELIEGVAPSTVEYDLCTPAAMESVCPFVEIPAPQRHGHTSRSDPEPLYKKTPSVERSVTLADCARFLTLQTTNRVVYDLDNLVNSSPHSNTENEVTEDSMQTPSSSVCMCIPSSCPSLEEANGAGKLSGGDLGITAGQGDGDSEDPDTAEISTLHFESRFECGNLRKAIQVRPYEYDLILNSDINSDHHHQWFYFKVSNMTKSQLYRFNIINCEKANSQFNWGMQPVLYSETEAHQGRPGWRRVATKITYYKNNFYWEDGRGGREVVVEGRKKQSHYYTLSFSLSFPHTDDNCYLAYHFPYSFSMLMYDLKEAGEKMDSSSVFYRHQTLCSTLCRNPCSILTITSPHTDQSHSEGCVGERKYVVLSARVHPGESNSSWVMRGVLQYLLSEDAGAQGLREKFVFKIIPMLNPDGVINGSHRFSLCGQDLNRQWLNPSCTLHPTIYHTKAILRWLVAHGKPPIVYCDFHGHSLRKNIFMYGCKSSDDTKIEQVLPRILDGIAPAFSMKTCSFAVEKSKEATARVVVWRKLGIPLSYTMESTYCATDQGPYKGRQITTEDLEEMGRCFCQALSQLQSRLASVEEEREVVTEQQQQQQEEEEDGEEHKDEDTQSASSNSPTDAGSSDDDNEHSS